jgi:membrane associated rhomboid family serine protease
VAGAAVARVRPVSLGAVLAAIWLLAVGVIAVVQTATGDPRPAELASTPDSVAHGALWTLLSSGLLIAGAPAAQLAGTALVVAAVLRLLGGAAFWAIALVGHVGATLLTYLAVGLLSLVAAGDVDRAIDAPDYGISAVWAACLGALAVVAAVRRSRALGVAAAALAATALLLFAVFIPQAGGVAAAEHLLALALGAAVAFGVTRMRASSFPQVAAAQ